MAQIARSVRFLHKAEAALLSAIEVYNRPTFAYREETFAILALNAWGLLFKAKLLAEHRNNPRCLQIFERRTNKDGKQSSKLYLRRNRSGAALTHSLTFRWDSSSGTCTESSSTRGKAKPRLRTCGIPEPRPRSPERQGRSGESPRLLTILYSRSLTS